MKAVVMECRIRVCASEDRVRRFVENARRVVTDAIPVPVRYSIVVEPVDSVLLARQWAAANRAAAGSKRSPGSFDVDVAFTGSGWLTPARLESLSRDILADVEADPGPGAEVVPWILTLTTSVDDVTRRRLARVHPCLDLTASVPISV